MIGLMEQVRNKPAPTKKELDDWCKNPVYTEPQQSKFISKLQQNWRKK